MATTLVTPREVFAIKPPAGVSLILAEEISRFIKDTYKTGKRHSLPKEWEDNKVTRAYFGCLSEAMLGETAADRWMKNFIFPDYGQADYDLDKSWNNQPENDIEDLERDISLVRLFLDTQPRAIDGMSRVFLKKYENIDADIIRECVVDGILHSLSSPEQAHYQDERLNFFTRYPKHLTVLAKKLLEENNVIFNKKSSVTEIDQNAWEQSRGMSGKIKFLNARSTKRGKSILISFLSKDKDALIAKLRDLVNNSDHDVFCHVCYHMDQRIINHRRHFAEMKKAIEDGKRPDVLDLFHKTSDTTRLVDSLTNEVADRRAGVENDTYERRDRQVKCLKSYTRDHILFLRKMGDDIVELVRKKAGNPKIEVRDRGCSISLGDIMETILILSASQADKLFDELERLVAEKGFNAAEEIKKRHRLVISKDKSRIVIQAIDEECNSYDIRDRDIYGRRNFRRLVDNYVLVKELKKVGESKRLIHDLTQRGLGLEEIVLRVNKSIEFVESTLSEDKYVYLFYKNMTDKDVGRVKNFIGWQWSKLIKAGLCDVMKKYGVETRRDFFSLFGIHGGIKDPTNKGTNRRNVNNKMKPEYVKMLWDISGIHAPPHVEEWIEWRIKTRDNRGSTANKLN